MTMNTTDTRIERLAAMARKAEPENASESDAALSASVLARLRAQRGLMRAAIDTHRLWERMSLISLPMAAAAAAVCLAWPGNDRSTDPLDLAGIFVIKHLLP